MGSGVNRVFEKLKRYCCVRMAMHGRMASICDRMWTVADSTSNACVCPYRAVSCT